MGRSGRSPDPCRAGARVLDTAEGVLIALRGCGLNEAFAEIAATAKTHNVSTLSLADALVGIAQSQTSLAAVDDCAIAAARAAWGHLFAEPRRAGQPAARRLDEDDEDEVVPGA